MSLLVVTIDGEDYEVEGTGSAADALAGFQQRMADGALDQLTLADGRQMLVHWGRVAALSVAAAGEPGPSEPLVGTAPRPLWSRKVSAGQE